MAIRFSWDAAKARSNRLKHGIDFETAEKVWEDPLHAIIFDRHVEGEERWWAIGSVSNVTVLVVVHTYINADEIQVQIISARKATPSERKRYEHEAS